MPHSEKSLFQLRSFHLALWTPILIAGLIVIYIIITNNLTFKSGFSGLNNAWDIFKVPLAIFSLIFPTVALVTANHRSIQSKKQIKAAESQNNFANYYKHLEEFNGMLKNENINKEFVSIRKLHKMLFPNSKDGSYRIDENLIKNLIVALQKIHQTLKELERFADSLKNSELTENEYTDKSVNLILVAYETLLNIRNSFKFNDTEYSPKSLKEKLKKNEVNIIQVIYEIKTTLNCLEKVLSFDEEFDMPDVLIKLIELVLPPKDNKAISIDNPIKIKLSNI